VFPAPDSGSPEAERDRCARPLSTAWITDELLERTRRVWSRVYKRPIDEAEAVEILMNVKRFAEVLLKAGCAENTP
jgi:hypothetical protein